MATVKVKLRPSSVEGRAGVIFYQITHNSQSQQVTTRFRVQPADWDASSQRLLAYAPNHTKIQYRIDSDVARLKGVIYNLETCGADYSASDVVRRYKSLGRHVLLPDYMRCQIEQLRAANRFGTARNYDKAMRSFEEFAGNTKVPLAALTEQVIADYNAYLIRRGLVRNSVSFYMRVLRAVYNKAVKQRLVEPTNAFADVYTGIDRTRKRAVPESVIAALNRLELPADSQLALARDLFIFSYCTRGMAFVDIAFLRKSDLRNETICYARRKTGQQLTVRIEPAIRRIIDRYASTPSPYVFPILTSADAAEAYEQYHIALNTHNRLLGMLSARLGCGCKLTSYTSRHSWATAARNHNVPISVISAGMGHTSEQTTRIYLAMLENSVIDDANRGIIGDLV